MRSNSAAAKAGAQSQGAGGHSGPIHVINNINVKAPMDIPAGPSAPAFVESAMSIQKQ
jgi:hypothetical protein